MSKKLMHVIFISIFVPALLLSIWASYNKPSQDEEEASEDLHKKYGYYQHHNYVNTDVKTIFLSYLKKHPNDVSSDIKIATLMLKDVPHYYFTSDAAFNFTSLDTTTNFNVPSRDDEFEYRSYQQKIISDSNFNKQIVAREIDNAPLEIKKSLSFYMMLLPYDFNSHVFGVRSISFSTLDDAFPGFCRSDILTSLDTNNPVNNVIYDHNNITMIDSAKQNAAYYIGYDDLSYGGKLGLSGSSCNPAIHGYLENGFWSIFHKLKNFSELSEENEFLFNLDLSQSHTIIGKAIPKVYMDLTELFLSIEKLYLSGVKVPESVAQQMTKDERKNYATGEALHMLSAKIVMSFVPSRDCKLEQVSMAYSDDVLSGNANSLQKQMICKPQFNSVILDLPGSEKAASNDSITNGDNARETRKKNVISFRKLSLKRCFRLLL